MRGSGSVFSNQQRLVVHPRESQEGNAMKNANTAHEQRAISLSRRNLLGVAGTATALGILGAGHAAFATPGASAQEATPSTEEVTVMVGDVVEYELEANGRWPGHFGSVTLKLHPGFFGGGDAWYIRTDASDLEFANEQELVYVPLLANALNVEGSFANLYQFAAGADSQRTVLSTVPTQDDFTPAFRINNVAFAGEATLLDSVEAILAAEAAGTVTIEKTDIVVNYPLVLWPDGGLPVDPDLANPLGPGILISSPDTIAGTVTFKLHQCYPGSRYIATDTSAVPMAGMMGIVGSAPTQLLIEAKATAPIYVFGNGIPGPAAMGFQPSIFNSKAGDVIWSPFWEHFTVVWNDPEAAVLLTSEAEVKEQEAAGTVKIYAGVPETDPVSFVVNCPVPILASNNFDPSTFVPLPAT